MAYEKTAWKDEVRSRPGVYTITDNGDGTYTITPTGSVEQPGTPLSAANLNKMENELEALDSGKVDKVSGKQLSTEDYTTTEKNKLAGLSNYDDTTAFNTMVRADAAGEDGKSQLYKVVNGMRENIDPVSSGGSAQDIEDIENLVYPKITVLGFANTAITLTSGTKTITVTPDSTGNITAAVPLLGTWTITSTYSGTTYTKTVVCSELGGEYTVVINQTWTNIQSLVRSGTFSQYYSVGDQFTIRYNGNDTLWDVVAIDVAIPADNTKTHSVTLMPHNCLESLMFDNKEPNNSDSSRKSYGNNRYLYSNIRQWLNSSAAAGSWYSNQHSADAAPDYATTKAGFMSYFDSDFLAVIGKTKIKTVKASVDGGSYEEMANEYFYLPSTTEVGLANENNIAEGTLFPYFDSNDKRIKQYSGSNKWWWLRTPYSGYSYYVRGVYTDGSLYSNVACYSGGVAPACNII